MDNHGNLTKIREALAQRRTHLPASYVCWVIEEFDTINEVERLCNSEIHNADAYKVETNFKLNIILKVDDKQTT